MGDVRIALLSDTVFRFEFETDKPIEEVKKIKDFKYEGRYYKVKRVRPVFENPGYFSYFITAIKLKVSTRS